MAPLTITGSKELGTLIRSRREELGMSIEQAATAADLGSETWRRYETGNSIRQDKARAVCRALKWRSLPAVGSQASASGEDPMPDMWETAAKSSAYSPSLAETYGEEAARAFAVGCDIVGDQLDDDLGELGTMPRDSHIGEVSASWFADLLPPRWLMRYDYDFMFRLRGIVETLRLRAVHPGYDGILHFTRCVADDLALHLIIEEGTAAFEACDQGIDMNDADEWEYEMNGEDDELILILYSESFDPSPDERWHFNRWFNHTYFGLGEKEGKAGGGDAPIGQA